MFKQSHTRPRSHDARISKARPAPTHRRPILESLEGRRVLAPLVTISVEDPPEISENAPPTGSISTLDYTLTRDETDETLTVKFELTGTATYDDDYSIRDGNDDRVYVPDELPDPGPAFGTANFKVGEDTAVVRVDPRSDVPVEVDETVIITIVEADEFGLTQGAAAQRNLADPVIWVVDERNRLAIVDTDIGCVDVIGIIDVNLAVHPITDIAFTEDGTLFGISPTHVFVIDYENVQAGRVPVDNLGEHEIPGAKALIDARDGDFGTDEFDLLAAGTNSVVIWRINIIEQNRLLGLSGDAIPVFNTQAALSDFGDQNTYFTSGDLDYISGGRPDSLGLPA